MDNKKKEYRKKAKELALQNGFDQVSYYGEWNGYLAYTASRKEDKECCIGYPQFILVKDDVAHLAPYTQSPDIMGMIFMPKDYSGTLL
ncbi:MAG: hypothetical protein ACK5LF_17260 [Bacteroides xylanisolvens]